MSESLKRGVDALMFLASRRSAGVTEIAEALGVNKSTAFRMMETLMPDNIVEKNLDTAQYRLGPAILKLADRYYSSLSAAAVARQHMERLSEVVGESVHLCVVSNNRAVVIDQIACAGILMANAKIGSTEPLHCSSVGKCLVAFAPEVRRERMIKEINYEEYTPHTITSEERFLEEIKKIKNNGFAIDNMELSQDVRCVSAPIFNNKGECNYSLGVSGPVSRMTDLKVERIIKEITKTAKKISAELGYEEIINQ